MKNFEYANPTSVQDAVALLSSAWGETEILAGGTDLLTSLKQNITEPGRLVSLSKVAGLDSIKESAGALHIGAMTTLTDLAWDAKVKKSFPSLVTAAEGVRSAQIMNRGTVGGDLCQRPRCWYYRQGFGLLGQQGDKSLIPDGDNRYHAIFGNSGPAYFVSPSSLAPALSALGATVVVQGAKNKTRNVAIDDFFQTPKSDRERENVLAPDEIVTEIVIPMSGKSNATYEIRMRTGLDWPLVAASVAFTNKGGKASDVKVVLGHVAPVPWNAPGAAKALEGKQISETVAAQCGEAATQGASALSNNGYKIHQVRTAVKRAIMAAVA